VQCRALKLAIPAIDGIDLDMESEYDQSTIVGFTKMLFDLGFKVSFCPYTHPTFWTRCLAQLCNIPKYSDAVVGFNLQCYGGGAGNQPGQWAQWIQEQIPKFPHAKAFVIPGDWCRQSNGVGDSPADMKVKFRQYKAQGAQSGFLWNLDLVLNNQKRTKFTPRDYSAAIRSGLGPGPLPPASIVCVCVCLM